MLAVVLGAGRVGSLIARDLAADSNFEVAVLDQDRVALERLTPHGIEGIITDFTDPNCLREATGDAAVVVNAVPGHMGYSTLRSVIELGHPCVDIAFMPEDSLELDNLAREMGVPVVVDMGVAPGMSNLLAGRGVALMDEALNLRIYVGGLPVERSLPWQYTIPFSPVDVLEEYTRPARLVVNRRVVTHPALSGLEYLEFPGVGTLEAFNTDGLRTLLTTLDCPNMLERTLRYPGYARKVKLLKDTGFFDTKPRLVAGQQVRPFDVAAALLFDAWKLEPDAREFTVMRVEVSGVKRGRQATVSWDLYDETDFELGATSMARTTGFPAAIVARWLVDGTWNLPGITPPEVIGRDPKLTQLMLEELKNRGVTYRFTSRDDSLLK